MADATPIIGSSEPATPPSSAAEQARIRKERREAKIRAGGSARLNKITGLGGGVQRDAPIQPKPQAHADDPEEVDISQHYYTPTSTQRITRSQSQNASPAASQQQAMNDDALRQMMLGFDPTPTPPPGANPFAGFPGMEGAPGEDPMMKMFQQMMGGMPGEGANGMPSFPGMPGAPTQEAATDPYAYLWRIVHAVFALGLGLYIAFTTAFTGTKIDRELSTIGYSSNEGEVLNPSSVYFFYIFATVEVLLQTSRFYMEKGRVQQGSIMSMVTGFLPEPWKGYLLMGSRYARIWTTVSADAMVCIFVLGVSAWLRGAV